MKKNLGDMPFRELEQFFEDLGEKKYRAEQVFRWIYRGICDFDLMSDIPVGLREKLKEEAEIPSASVREVRTSSDGTKKYLLSLADGAMIECVFMSYKFGGAVCVSSQAGCRMGCVFCASGKMGLARNLSAGEMAGQVLKVQEETGERVSRVVVMGIGEPFDNYDSLADFIRLINDERGLNIGFRNITVSTCGIIPMIKMFSDDFPQVNLAVSLHAANGAKRQELMPVTKKYGYGDLIASCREYAKRTRRRITFEYMLIGGNNDGISQADELVDNLRGMLCHVNLILMNKVKGLDFTPCSREKAELFRNRLESRGVAATIRRSLGDDIEAACGQLRLSYGNGG